MKTFICVTRSDSMSILYCQAQSIVGRWQLVKESNCVERRIG